MPEKVWPKPLLHVDRHGLQTWQPHRPGARHLMPAGLFGCMGSVNRAVPDQHGLGGAGMLCSNSGGCCPFTATACRNILALQLQG